MIINMYSVHDAYAEKWQAPMPLINDAVALRHLRQLVRGMSADDAKSLSIYRVGRFDDDTGSLEILAKPVEVVVPSSLNVAGV